MDERERKKRKLHELWDGVARRSGSPAGTGCPDPEILSAYFMHTLGKEETAQWDSHFSLCPACQEALAALVKTASVEEAALASEHTRDHELGDMWERVDAAAQLSRLSQTEPALMAQMAAVAPAPPPTVTKPVAIQPTQTKPSLRERISWRWFAPALAAAAVFAVWLTVRMERAPTANGVQIAENKPSTQPATPNPAESAPPPDSTTALDKEKREATQSGVTSVGGATTSASGAPQGLAKKAAGTAPSVNAEADALRVAGGADSSPKTAATPAPPPAPVSLDNKIDRADGQQVAMNKVEAPPAKPAAADARAFSQAAPALKQPARKVAAAEERARLDAAAPVTEYRAEEPAVGGRFSDVQTVESAKAAHKSRSGAQIFAPGRKIAWSVGPLGLILRSPDGGVSWVRQESGVKADLLSGSAPSETVCWVAGRAGTILLTTDGEHWSKIASPGTQNWIGIQATDALHAVVWDLNSAHKFSTSDGGQTWQGAAQ